MYYSLTRATLWNIAGYLYLIVASLISTPILVHSLGLAQFGQYSLVIATLGLVATFNLGLPQAVTRTLSQDHQHSVHRNTLWSTSSVLFITSGLLAGLIAILISVGLALPSATFPLIFGLALMNNLLSHYATLPQAQGHFGYFNAKTFIVGTANTLLAAYLSAVGQGIVVILSSQLLCYLLTLLPLVYFSLKFFPRPWTYRPSLSLARSLISFGLKNQVGTLTGQVQAQYAKYLLAPLSPIALSSYVIARGLVQKFSGGVAQVATALYPASARSSQSSLRPLYYRLQLALALCSLLGIFGFWIWGFGFLTWWLDSPELVSQVDSVMRILVWYLGALVLTPLSSSVLDARGRPEITSFFALLTTIIEITLALLLFPRYGFFAPIYSALIALLLTTPALLLTTDRVLKSRL